MIEQFLKWFVGHIDYRFYMPLFIDFLKSLLWPATIICLTIIFRKQISKMIEKLESLEGFGARIKMKSRTEDAAPKLTGFRTKDISLPEETTVQDENQVISDLAFLLFKYRFVWSEWAIDPDYCHAVRFSEKYSGGTLRYIDEFVKELNSFIKEKGDKLSAIVGKRVRELSSYINGVLPYHEKNERLSGPVFSAPQYQVLLRSLSAEISAIKSKTPNQAN